MNKKETSKIFQATNYCDGSTDECLDVRFTAFCDNSCSFCIAAEDMKNVRSFNPEAMLEAVKKHTEINSLSIIGGEPLLFLDKLIEFMDSVENQAPHIKNMYLTTALPYSVITQKDKFDKVMQKTSLINISLQHYNDKENNLILKAKNKYSRLSNLEEILSNDNYRDKVIINLNLIRGGIDSSKKLNKMLYILKEMGASQIKINELMNAPEDYVNFEKMIGEELDSPYSFGCSTKIDYFPGLETTLKRSCFVVESSLKATKQDLLKLIAKSTLPELEKDMSVARVLYEDGTVTNRWQGDAV